MAAKKWLRKRFLVDYRVQGALIVRIVLYWLMCLFVLAMFLLGLNLLKGPPRTLNAQLTDLWAQFGPAAVASLLLLPVVILDVMQMSNRFAGPMFRLRRSMRDLAQGKPVAAVRFRKGDFWQDFAQDFNTVAERLGKLTPNNAYSSWPVDENDSRPILENACAAE